MGWNYISIPKLQRLHRWCLEMGKWFHPTTYNWCYYLCMPGLKLNHVSKRGSRGNGRQGDMPFLCFVSSENSLRPIERWWNNWQDSSSFLVYIIDCMVERQTDHATDASNHKRGINASWWHHAVRRIGVGLYLTNTHTWKPGYLKQSQLSQYAKCICIRQIRPFTLD